MLKVLREKEFEPDEPEILMAAFKLLDQEEKGYIEVEVIRNTL
jgi:Ca2+-binding EF-hand superfamily protein